MLKIDYAKKIAEAYYPKGEDLTGRRASYFIKRQMTVCKQALKELSVTADRFLTERK